MLDTLQSLAGLFILHFFDFITPSPGNKRCLEETISCERNMKFYHAATFTNKQNTSPIAFFHKKNQNKSFEIFKNLPKF